jgi:hypothetical protein
VSHGIGGLQESSSFNLRAVLILAFAQLTYRESLRDIANGLGAGSRLYHSGSARRRHAALWRMPTRSVIGASSPTPPSSCPDPPRRRLHVDEPFGGELTQMAYTLTPPRLTSASVFLWATFRKAGRHRCIPSVPATTPGGDHHAGQRSRCEHPRPPHLKPAASCLRPRLPRLHPPVLTRSAGAFYVTRAKKNFHRPRTTPCGTFHRLRGDQTVALVDSTHANASHLMRRVLAIGTLKVARCWCSSQTSPRSRP